jgi:hypothetical protein
MIVTCAIVLICLFVCIRFCVPCKIVKFLCKGRKSLHYDGSETTSDPRSRMRTPNSENSSGYRYNRSKSFLAQMSEWRE